MSPVCLQTGACLQITIWRHKIGKMAFTDAQIKALKPKASRYLVSDGRGLSLDVLPSGKMSWLFRYRLNASSEKVILGRYPDLTLKAARAKRDDLAAQVADGKSPDRKSTRLNS